MSIPEYVDVYGIPFQAFPVKGERKGSSTAPKPQTLVQALRERRELEITFPRVVGYISDARFRITADVASIPRLEVTPSVEPTVVKVGAKGEGKGAVHDRAAFYGEHRLARTIFDLAASITDHLKFGDERGRRIMFPQVLGIVRAYVNTRIDFIGVVQPEEIGLGVYRTTIESRLIAAIRPADEEGEQPLLPVLNDMAGIGSTDISPFLTVKTCIPTTKSHLSHAVIDSGWEGQVANALDESPKVHSWVKNLRLGLEVPYQHQGKPHQFVPDFVAVLRGKAGGPSDEHLMIEVKGLEREQDRSKDAGAARWIAAVNHWGRLGHWRYVKLRSPHDLEARL